MKPARPLARRHDAGVTLVEILVSLAIIGAMASVVMLSARPAYRGGAVEIDARRLAGLLDLAASEALTTGDRIVFAWDGSGYGFRAGEGALPAFAARTALGRGISMTGEPAQGQHAIGGAFDAAFTLTLEAGGTRWQVVFDGIAARASRASRATSLRATA